MTDAPFPEPFRIETRPERSCVRIVLHGELDISTTPDVERALSELRESGWKELVLDLSALSFLDSSGVHLVLRWTQEASADGIDLALVRGPAAVQRVFEIAGVADHLPFRPR
jgi:anti-anti-sigma factor